MILICMIFIMGIAFSLHSSLHLHPTRAVAAAASAVEVSYLAAAAAAAIYVPYFV